MAGVGFRRQRRVVLDDDDVAGGRLDELAVVVDAGVKADGVDEGVGGDPDRLGALDERFERHAEIGPAAGENSGGMDVAIDGGVVRDAVFFGESVRALPAEEAVLDGFALGMAADIALARVPRDGRSFSAFCGGGLRRSFWIGIVMGQDALQTELALDDVERDRRPYEFCVVAHAASFSGLNSAPTDASRFRN